MRAEKAAIWDVDGTLVDTAELHFAAWIELAAEIGKPFTRADFTVTFGRRNPEILRSLYDPDMSDQTIAEFGNRKEAIYRAAAMKQGVSLLPGVRELLDGLQKAGWKQAVGSSAPRNNLEMILDQTGTRAYFDAIVAMEDTARGKPDPQVFLIAAEKLSMSPNRCVVFEDAVAGVLAAKAAGMACVAVRFVAHHSAEALRAAGADIDVPSLGDIDVGRIENLLPID